MALIAGVQAPAGRIMGHAGAMVRAGENSAKAKIKNLEDAGVTIVNHPSKFGERMKQLLSDTSRPSVSLRILLIPPSCYIWPALTATQHRSGGTETGAAHIAEKTAYVK